MAPIKAGQTSPIPELETIMRKSVKLVDNPSGGLVHLMLRRFSGCPICNSHLKNFSRFLDQVQKENGIRVVVIFHSPAGVIHANVEKLEWAQKYEYIADPERTIYEAFGAQVSAWSMASFEAIKAGISGYNDFGHLNLDEGGAEKTRFQRPMDVLIDTATGKVVASYHGQNPYDQWTPSQVIEAAREYREGPKHDTNDDRASISSEYSVVGQIVRRMSSVFGNISSSTVVAPMGKLSESRSPTYAVTSEAIPEETK